MPQPLFSSAAVRPPWLEPLAVDSVIACLPVSDDPVAVFESLATAVVPLLAAVCRVTITTADGKVSEAEFPSTRRRTVGSEFDHVVELVETSSATACVPGFAVEVQLRISALATTDGGLMAVAARSVGALLVRRAVDIVRQSCLERALARSEAKALNLEVALESNRVISQAVGVLMSSRRATAEQAFRLLRDVSQHTHRKLRDIAEEVCETGMLEPARVADSPAGRSPATTS